jgi:hypothetical protein
MEPSGASRAAAHDLTPDWNRPVPTAVLGDQSVAAEAAEEMDSEGCDMCLKVEDGRNLPRWRSRLLEPFEPDSASEIGKAIKAARPKRVQLVRRNIVAHSVGAVVSEEHGAPRQSKPTELRTPQATRRRSDPSWSMLTIVPCSPRGKQMLQGDPNDT